MNPTRLFNKEKEYPIIPIRSGVVFPQTESVLVFGRERSVAAVNKAASKDGLAVVVMQKKAGINEPTPGDLYQIGTLVRIEKILKNEESTRMEVNALIRGLSRVQIVSYESFDSFLSAKVVELPDVIVESDKTRALSNHLVNQLKKAITLGKSLDFGALMRISAGLTPLELSNQIAAVVDIKSREKQALLEELDVNKRLEKCVAALTAELKVLEIEKKISKETQAKFDKNFRKTVLEERLKTIEKELGKSGENREISEYLDKIKNAAMPAEVEEKAKKELKRLSQMSSYNPEGSYLRTYLDWLCELPWSKTSANHVEMKRAQKVLDTDHFGLDKIKERIVEYLAVVKLRNLEKKQAETAKKKIKDAVPPTILCFVGPPGVGKTSLGRSIARALGREFVKMSLGGIRDEAEIRGHRRTYVGAMPGRIIQAIKTAGTKNPVFMLDEIDKIGSDFRGDPSAALLEALDPEQNKAFEDHYLETPFDLSDVFFITTCNILETIPPALRDRLEIIHFPGYTQDEKFHIARKYLVAKQLKAHVLNSSQAVLTDSAINLIIERYTREAGVRSLERQIAQVFRKIARKVAEGEKKKITVSTANLGKFLGPFKFTSQIAEKKDEIGMSTGLAWTEAGGDILFIEIALMPGKGNLMLTGQLGDVMKESCQAALSYIRSRYEALKLPKKFYETLDIHVHVPEGAVPKDGPSAGIAITTALVSALTKRPVRRDIGMTGEVTLRGRALEIGGVKEKVIAAHRAGLKTIIMPKDNQKDLEDIPKNVLKDLNFKFVKHMDEVLKLALTK